jgi:hypothetical protein
MKNHIKAGTFQFKENWKIDRVDNNTGEILDSEEFCNLIVNNGLERVARLINGDSSTYFRALAIGTGSTAATNSDSALETEFTRAAATLSYEASYKSKFTHTFTFGTGISETITEAGIFDSATMSGSTMLARLVFTGKEVSPLISLIITATVTVARA